MRSKDPNPFLLVLACVLATGAYMHLVDGVDLMVVCVLVVVCGLPLLLVGGVLLGLAMRGARVPPPTAPPAPPAHRTEVIEIALSDAKAPGPKPQPIMYGQP